MRKVNVRWQSSVGTAGMALTVEEATSGQDIMRLQFTPEQVFTMITGGGSRFDGVPAFVMTDEESSRLGKKLHIFTRRVGQADYGTTQAVKAGEIPEAWQEWSRKMQTTCWAQNAHWSVHNYGLRYSLHRYDNDLTDEQAKGIKLLLMGAELPEGLKDL